MLIDANRFFNYQSQIKGTHAELVALPCKIDGIDWKPEIDTLWMEYFLSILWYIGCFCLYSKYMVKKVTKTQPEVSYHSPPLYPKYFWFGRVHNDTRMLGSGVYSNGKLMGILHANYDTKAIFCTPTSIRYCVENACKS